MKLISRTFLTIAVSTFFSLTTILTTQAAEQRQPPKCPSVSALQRIHLQTSDFIEKKPGKMECCTASGFPYWVDGTWESVDLTGNDETTAQWKFTFYNITANKAEQALQSSTKVLSTLSFAHGPTNEMGRWYCSYMSAYGEFDTWYVE